MIIQYKGDSVAGNKNLFWLTYAKNRKGEKKLF